MAMDEMKMTEKQTQKLKDWKRWGLMMKMLKAIHREGKVHVRGVTVVWS